LEKHQGSEGKMNLKSEVAERLHQEGERMGTPKTLVLFMGATSVLMFLTNLASADDTPQSGTR
jgi:hypothetical protein